jgi:hypothetical protein
VKTEEVLVVEPPTRFDPPRIEIAGDLDVRRTSLEETEAEAGSERNLDLGPSEVATLRLRPRTGGSG